MKDPLHWMVAAAIACLLGVLACGTIVTMYEWRGIADRLAFHGIAALLRQDRADIANVLARMGVTLRRLKQPTLVKSSKMVSTRKIPLSAHQRAAEN